jgi:hypothetical protein
MMRPDRLAILSPEGNGRGEMEFEGRREADGGRHSGERCAGRFD